MAPVPVNTTGHFYVTSAAMRAMKIQGTGGSLVFNATKNVTASGSAFGAYSVSKAGEAQFCRIAAIEAPSTGVRANMSIRMPFSRIRDCGRGRKRPATAHGITLEELPDFYRRRNLLKLSVTAEDVAEAVLFLVGPRSAKTTGAMIPVDGGVREAFPR